MRKILLAMLVAVLALPVWAVTMGDDGLHKTDWMRDTFKDMGEDLAEANAEGKRLMVIIEQRGCIYCARCTMKSLLCLRLSSIYMTTSSWFS